MWVRRKDGVGGVDIIGREGPVKSKEKGLVTLYGLIHCATEITTEPI